MTKTKQKYGLGLLGLFVSLVALNSSAIAAKRALVYNGPGACADGCYQAAYLMALQAGLDPTYVGPMDINAKSTDDEKKAFFKDVAVWIQPGGHSAQVLQAMSVQMVNGIREFVGTGGAYVGFCAGAFSATQWVGTTSTMGLDIFPGFSTVYKARYNAEIIPITWEGKPRSIYWEGGPYLSEIPPGLAEVIATYPTGQIAAARAPFGTGRVFIAGFHPEAPQDWRDYYGLKDPDGLDYDLAQEMIAWATAAH